MRLGLGAATAIVALAAVAGAAAALVIYDNDFSGRGQARDLRKLDGGKTCDRSWSKKRKALTVEVRKGAASCLYGTPVQGEGEQPDHTVEVEATLAESAPKSLRDRIFVGVAVRSGDDAGYELRVLPGTRAWELRRSPALEGFPMKGTNGAIARPGRPNRLALEATGDRVTATVNGTSLVDGFVDPRPAEVTGRRTAIAFGSAGKVRKSVAATLDDLRVAIPGP